MNLNRLSILSVLLLINGCAHTSFPQYPSISGTIKSGGKPVPSMKVILVEDTWDSDAQNCKGKSRAEKTNREGYFNFKQKNNSVFITPFNFESASDKMMEDNDLMMCIFQNDSYIPVLELARISHDGIKESG